MLLICLILTSQTRDDGTKDVEIMLPLKYLSKFWRAPKMYLINCETNHILTWSANCVIDSAAVANQSATFSIPYTKLYVQVVTLSTQNDAKLLQQLKSGFKRTINWNKYQSKETPYNDRNPYLYYLTDPIFHEVNGLFLLSIENNEHQKVTNDIFFQP